MPLGAAPLCLRHSFTQLRENKMTGQRGHDSKIRTEYRGQRLHAVECENIAGVLFQLFAAYTTKGGHNWMRRYEDRTGVVMTAHGHKS